MHGSSGKEPAALADARPLPPTVVVQATRGWSTLGLRELWEYRELLYFLVWRDIRGRFRQTMLGPLWFVIAPLMRMVVFSFVFGIVAKLPSEGIPYPLFTYSALLPWELFAGVVQRSTGSLVGTMHVISKVYFPRLLVPLSAALSGAIDFVISLVILLGMAFVLGYPPGGVLLVLPIFILEAMVLGLGLGLWLATAAVKYRDVANFVGYGLSFWMYLTPVAYSAGLVPERYLALYRLNPMYWVVEGFRWSILDHGAAPGGMMLATGIVAGLVLLSGAYVFRRTEKTIVDLL